jgi:hypothetical protein
MRVGGVFSSAPKGRWIELKKKKKKWRTKAKYENNRAAALEMKYNIFCNE